MGGHSPPSRRTNLPLGLTMKIETLPLRVADIVGNNVPSQQTRITAIDRITCAVSEFRAWIQTFPEHQRQLDAEDSDRSWLGFTEPSDSSLNLVKTGLSPSALKAFNTANARIVADYRPDSIALSPIGASFSIGRLQAGHPVACFRRPKTRLAPLRIEFNTRFAAFVSSAHLTAPLAQIMRAAWQYHLAGGIVTLQVNYFCGYSTPNPRTGGTGFMLSLLLPLADEGAIASFVSVQFARGARLAAGRLFHGRRPSFPGLFWADSKAPTLWGDVERDKELFKKLKIQDPLQGG